MPYLCNTTQSLLIQLTGPLVIYTGQYYKQWVARQKEKKAKARRVCLVWFYNYTTRLTTSYKSHGVVCESILYSVRDVEVVFGVIRGR